MISFLACITLFLNWFPSEYFLRIGFGDEQPHDEPIAVVESLEKSFRGLTVSYEFSYSGKDENEWMSTDESGNVASRQKLSQSQSGHYLRFFKKDMVYNGEREVIKTANNRLFRVISRDGIAVSVDPQYADSFIASLDTSALEGVSFSDQTHFSHLLKDPSMKVVVDDAVYNGLTCQVLRGESEVWGEYDFWIESQPIPRVTRIEVRKLGHHRISNSQGKYQSLHDAPTINEQVAKGMSEKELTAYRSSLNAAPRVERQKEVYLFENYESQYGRLVPKRVKKSATAWLKSGEPQFLGSVYTITDVEPFEIDDPNRAIFESIEVPNGIPVDVFGQEGMAWKYEDGTLVRVVDSGTVGNLDGVRFRKPQSKWLYYLGLTAIAIVLLLTLCRRWWKGRVEHGSRS